MSYVLDYLGTQFTSTNALIGNLQTYNTAGQPFLNIAENILDSAKFYMLKSNSPTGAMNAKLYAHTGTYGTSSVGTGTALATSDTVDASTLTTSNTLITFTFSGANRVKLSANTYYIIAVEFNGGDATNTATVAVNTSNAGFGNRASKTSLNVWTARTDDLIFYVYGDFPPVAPLQLPAPSSLSIPTTYLYKVYDTSGTYIGLLDNVVSDFKYNQTINTAGTQIEIEIEQNEPDSFTVNNNRIEVYEINNYYPNGLLKFNGYISKWQATYGGNDNIKLTCLNLTQDTNNIYLATGQSAFLSQATDTGNTYVDPNTGPVGLLQTFTVGSNITCASVDVEISVTSGITAGLRYYVEIWQQAGGAPSKTADTRLGQGWVSVPSAISTKTVKNVTITSKPALTTATNYYIKAYWNGFSGASDGTTYYSNANPYAGGQMYTVTNLGFSTEVDTPSAGNDMYFVIYQQGGGLSGTYASKSTGYIMRDIMLNYQSNGGSAQIPNLYIPAGTAGFPLTYDSVTYTFKIQTILQSIQKVLDLAPAGYYWYIDPATLMMTFQIAATYPEIIVRKTADIKQLEVVSTKEKLINNVYFVGGDDGTATNTDIFVNKNNVLTGDRLGSILLTDNRVTSTTGGLTTARLIAQNYLDNNNVEKYETKLFVPANVTDVNLFHIGQMVGFNGFGNFVDSLLLQIVNLAYSPDGVELTLGSVPPKTSTALNKLSNSLQITQTAKAPITPS